MVGRGRRRVGFSHFFKVILPCTLEDKKLRIPEKFVRKFGDELCDVATLTLPNGRVWQIGLLKEGTKIWFHNGWPEFVRYHSICNGYFLVFNYDENSSFHVLIFDMSACEIWYPYSGGDKESENDKDDDSVEILGCTTYPSQENHKQAFCSATRINWDRKYATSFNSSRFKYSQKHGSRKVKIEELEINKPQRQLFRRSTHNRENNKSVEGVVGENELQRAAHKAGINKAGKFDEHEFFSLLDEMGIIVSESCKKFTIGQKQMAIRAARLFNPKNPSFLVMLRPSFIHNNYVYVPANFFRKYFSKDIKTIKIRDSDGRVWPVTVTWPQGGCFLNGRRGGFLEDKCLRTGDICVFELVRLEDLLLKISVFPSSTE